jgi:ketosteroid isomerase-like protein
MTDARIGVVDQYLEALQSEDVDRLIDLSAPETEWHLPGRSTLAGDHYGSDDVRSFLTSFLARVKPIEFDPQDMLTSENHVIVMHNAVVGEGRTNVNGCLLFDIREGKVHKVFAVQLDLYAMDEILTGS